MNTFPSICYWLSKNKSYSEKLLLIINNSEIQNDTIEFLPFWIFCLRVLSSFFCIKYEPSIFNNEDLEKEIRLLKNKNNCLTYEWLNLVVEN